MKFFDKGECINVDGVKALEIVYVLATVDEKVSLKHSKNCLNSFAENGRGDWIRTSDLLNPILVKKGRYRFGLFRITLVYWGLWSKWGE